MFKELYSKTSDQFYRLALKTKVKQPEIMLGLGIFGVIVASVWASKNTYNKADEIIEGSRARFASIEDSTEVKDVPKETTKAFLHAGYQFAKLYSGPVILGAASIGLIYGSHNIMKKRNFALVAAYKAIEDGFKKYRERVISDVGKDKDTEYRYGVKKDLITSKVLNDETGKYEKKTIEVPIVASEGDSIYAVTFDHRNPYFEYSYYDNITFIKRVEEYLNLQLIRKKFVLLNEAYHELGFPPTNAGMVVGWIYESEKGDGQIILSTFNSPNEHYYDKVVMGDNSKVTAEEWQRYINSTHSNYTGPIVIDFNVEGSIHGLI